MCRFKASRQLVLWDDKIYIWIRAYKQCFRWVRSKPSLKIRSVNKAVLFRYWQQPKKYLLRNKTFFVFQGRILKLSESVWKRILWNRTKFQFNQTTDENSNCLNEPNELIFWTLHEILFQTDAASFSFLSWKSKTFYF